MEKSQGDALYLTISEHAITDIEDILIYSLQNHGETTASRYIASLDTKLKSLLNNPTSGQNFNWLKQDVRRLTYKQHNIYYMLKASEIKILRVLHQRQDPADKL